MLVFTTAVLCAPLCPLCASVSSVPLW